MTADGAVARAASGTRAAGAGDAGRFPVAAFGEGSTGRHDAPGLTMAARAGSVFVCLAEWPHQLKGELAIGTGVFINGHLSSPTI